MNFYWSPGDPKGPATFDADELPKSAHVGVLRSTILAGPPALYTKGETGFALSRVMDVGVDTYAPGGSSPLHSHADTEKMFVVLEGRAKITIGDESRILDQGGTAFIPVNVRHGFENAGDGNLVILAAFAYLVEPGATGGS